MRSGLIPNSTRCYAATCERRGLRQVGRAEATAAATRLDRVDGLSRKAFTQVVRARYEAVIPSNVVDLCLLSLTALTDHHDLVSKGSSRGHRPPRRNSASPNSGQAPTALTLNCASSATVPFASERSALKSLVNGAHQRSAVAAPTLALLHQLRNRGTQRELQRSVLPRSGHLCSQSAQRIHRPGILAEPKPG